MRCCVAFVIGDHEAVITSDLETNLLISCAQWPLK